MAIFFLLWPAFLPEMAGLAVYFPSPALTQEDSALTQDPLIGAQGIARLPLRPGDQMESDGASFGALQLGSVIKS